MKTFITSLNAKLFSQYGYQFLKGWEAMAAPDVELIVCFEGQLDQFDSSVHMGRRYRVIPIESEVQQFFLKKFGGLSEMRGFQYSIPKKGKPLNVSYNYRFDAIRFSFKIFAFFKCLEMNLLKNDFAWLDADIVCKRPFSSSDLQEFFPEEDQLASYLGRKNFPNPNPYSECGFVGYNFTHPMCINFISEMLDMYISGNLLMLKEWHDCMVFDYTRKNFEVNHGIKFKDLAAEAPLSNAPFSDTKLSLYFDHLKGPVRKAQFAQQLEETGENLVL